MFECFQQILQNNDLLDSTEDVLLAVSGGVDSVVLLDLIQQLPDSRRPKISVAHVNHQLRDESDEEERFVERLATKYNVPFYVYRWDKSKQPKSGIEAAAREERYTFFKEIMIGRQIRHLMTAHHLDDQVETILMRLTRGSSLEQLTGIEMSQSMDLAREPGFLIRPLLPFSKHEIYQYAAKHQLDYREDVSNQSLDFTRNRFRNQIIPLLKEENEKFNQHMEQFSSDLTDLIEIAQGPIHNVYREIVQVEETSIQLNLIGFITYSKALQRAVLTKILNVLYEGRSKSYKTNYIELIRNWLSDGEVNTQLDLIGPFMVRKSYHEAYFVDKPLEEDEEFSESFQIQQFNEWIKISDTESMGLFLAEQGKAESTEKNPSGKAYAEIDQLVISEDHLHLPLTLRHRKPGDRMTYDGLNGTKKIKDIFIDDKTPPTERKKAWVIEDSSESIIWLTSHRKMNLFTAQETDKLVYVLKYKRLNL